MSNIYVYYLFSQDKDNLSFTRTVNVTVFECGTFDLIVGHSDGQHRCTTHSARQSVHHH